MIAKRSNDPASAYLTVLTFERCAENTFAWVARHPDLPGCMSDGQTPEEALVNLADARTLYIEVLTKRGIPIPAPGSSPAGRAIVAALDESSRLP